MKNLIFKILQLVLIISAMQSVAQNSSINLNRVEINSVINNQFDIKICDYIYVNDSIRIKVNKLKKGFEFHFFNANQSTDLAAFRIKARSYRLYFSENYCLVVAKDISKTYSTKSLIFKIDFKTWETSKSKFYIEKYVGLDKDHFYFQLSNKKKDVSDLSILKVSRSANKIEYIESDFLSDINPNILLFNGELLLYKPKDENVDNGCQLINIKRDERISVPEISNIYYGLYFFYNDSVLFYDENQRTFYSLKNNIQKIVELKETPGSEDFMTYFMKDFRLYRNLILIVVHGVDNTTYNEVDKLLIYNLEISKFLKKSN